MSTSGIQVNERLRALVEAGCAPWLDQIRRSMVEGGELARMVREESLRGVTSNPSIFEKAILGSEDYDDALRELIGEGLDAPAIFERLAVQDVQGGCDVLAGVHRETQGGDGFVSLEVLPDAAHDTDRTLELARRYFGLVERPNVMIKIPGTTEGVPAIEQAIYEGINVNVTLLFSVESYANVAEAYLRGLERRHQEGKPLGIHSVASFFVSRVDSNVDKKLATIGREDLIGLAAVANARAAYEKFGEIFSGERWERLASAGAFVQRPLWASTGTKDQRYSDVKYVEELIANDTVNTMPMATLIAFADHGTVSGQTGAVDPSEDLGKLAEAGIDMEQVTLELLDDGVAQFIDAMNRLLAGIDARLEAVRTRRPPTIDAQIPAGLRDAISERVRSAEAENVAERVWRRDATLWGAPGTGEIENRLGWLTVSETMQEHAGELHAFAESIRQDGYTDAVLLGMGGSSLGPEVIRRSFGSDREPLPGGLRLRVLDSTHPDEVLGVQDEVEIEKTVFIVSSKSGGTIETLSHYRYFRQMARPEQFVVVTDPGSPLERIARDNDLRRVFLNPSDIGGRYSVMSYFGLVPSALMGVSIEALLHSCQVGEQSCAHYDSGASNPGLWLGAVLGELARRGRDKLTFVVDQPIASFGLWVEQLIAESTGKQGRGILPVAGEPFGDPTSYGEDRVFLHLRHGERPDAAADEQLAALRAAGHPTLTVEIAGAADLGRVCFLAEFATAVAGWALEINPFDQPNVQEAKDNTARVLDSGAIPQIEPADDAALRGLLDGAGPPHYVAVLGYLPLSEAVDRAADQLRIAIRGRTGAATTFGYGPRFQHSTGQLHKGGPPTGRFLQLTSLPVRDVEIPRAGYSFGRLIAAQAAGEVQTLREHGLPVERVVLEGDPATAIAALAQRIKGL